MWNQKTERKRGGRKSYCGIIKRKNNTKIYFKFRAYLVSKCTLFGKFRN